MDAETARIGSCAAESRKRIRSINVKFREKFAERLTVGGRAGFQIFARDGSGQVAILFALTLLPLIGIVGLAIDYGRAAVVKSDLSSAADETALAVVSSLSTGQSGMTSTQITNFFKAAADSSMSGATYSVSSTTNDSVTSVSATVSYTATVPTIFGGLFGLPNVSLSGTSSATGQMPPYVNFYLLLDNSPSMGLGATPADIQNLEDLTPDSCAFVCHQHTFNSQGQIIGDEMGDYYHIAKDNDITTRIDVLRTATQTLMTTAANDESVPNQFGMALYTFNDTFQALSSMTKNLSAVQNAASGVDLAYAYFNQRDTQTSYDSVLKYINQIVPTAGAGLSSMQPQEFIFLVTDGVEDEPVGGGSGNGDPADYWDTGQSGWPTDTKGNVKNSKSGNVSSTRLITTMNQTVCTRLKNKGAKIAILYTPYLPVTNNAFYNQWVAPISDNIPSSLTNCASPGFFFEVTPTEGISQAMQAMFNAAISEARLTN